MGVGRTAVDGAASDPRQRGGRRSANALMPSRMSSRGERGAAQLDQLLLDVGASSPSAASRAAITRLLPFCDSGALPASSAAISSAGRLEVVGGATRFTRPQAARSARRCSCQQEQLARARRADRVDEAAQAGVRVDEPQLGRRHAELDPSGRRAGRRTARAPGRRRSCARAAPRASGGGTPRARVKFRCFRYRSNEKEHVLSLECQAHSLGSLMSFHYDPDAYVRKNVPASAINKPWSTGAQFMS